MGFPLLVRAIRLSIEAVDARLESAAGTLGANPLWVFATITLPLCLPGVIAGAILCFAKAMGEFGATITFVSNIPGETQTLPSLIYTFTQIPGGDAGAMRLTLVSIAISMLALLGSELLARRIGVAASDGGMSLDVDIDHARGSFRLAARFSAAPGLTALFGRSGSGKTTPGRHRRRPDPARPRPRRRRRPGAGRHRARRLRAEASPPHRLRLPGQPAVPASQRAPQPALRALVQPRGRRRRAGDLASVVELLGIGHLLERRPASLSGGEKQRVAIGRALLAHPRSC